MSAWLWIAGTIIAAATVTVALNRLPRQRAGAVAALTGAALMVLLRQFVLAFPLAMIGVSLWRFGAPGPAPMPGQQSQVRSEGLAMTLDRDTGEMNGEILTGPLTGEMLSRLDASDLQVLVQHFTDVEDDDSLSLLLAWLDRRRAHTGQPPPDGDKVMDEAEACRILGLEPGASLEDVREAHRRLIRKVHPDLGGTSVLAAMINDAKDLLDPG